MAGTGPPAWLAAPLCGALFATAAVAQHPVFIHRGVLQDPATVGTGAAFKEVELADLNADGRLDLVLPQKQNPVGQGPNKDILYNSFGGQLILAVDSLLQRFDLVPTSEAFVEPDPQNPLITSRAYDVELADFDGDGALDILRPDRDGRVDIWWGHKDPITGLPDGTFRERTDVLAEFGPNPNQGCGGGVDGNYDDVDIVNLDGPGDTDLDFVVAQRQICSGSLQSTNVLVESLRSQGQSRSFIVRQEGELPAASTHSVAFGRADGDSAYDVALSEFGVIHLYFGEPGSPFFFQDPPQVLDELFGEPGIADAEAVAADLVDLDGDGCLDIFVGENAIDGTIAGVYFNSCGVGTKQPFPQTACGGGGQPACAFVPAPQIVSLPMDIDQGYKGLYDARYGDLDGDGFTEIVTVNQNVDNSENVFSTVVQVLRVVGRNLVDVTTTFMQPVQDLEGGMGIELGDLDNDGDDDMVLAGAVFRTVISPPIPVIRAAATVYENRTLTHIELRSLATGTVVGIEQLRADNGTEILSGGNVRFESSQEIVLGDGFVANAGSEFQACITGACS